MAIILAAGIFLLLVLRSPAFQACTQANQGLGGHNTIYDDFASFFWVTYWCTGIFVSQNGEGITALATIVMAAFTGTLWWATTEQGKLTKEALVVSTRAFVFLEDFEFSLASRFQHDGFDPDVGEFQISPRWRNSGDTPTKGLILRVTVRTHDGELPANFDYSFDGEPMPSMIGPKANEWTPPIEVVPQAANRVLDGETNLYVWARAEYHDVFGRRHYTLSCSRVILGVRDREVQARFILYGPYNRTDEDD